MSMEIYALSDRRLRSMAAWQSAIDAERFGLVLDTERPFGKLQGYLPAVWKGRQAGFECDHWQPGDVLDGYSEIHFPRRWTYCLAFRWGGDFGAGMGGYMAASAYAIATGGVVFDPDSGEIMGPLQARQAVHQMEKDLPLYENLVRSIGAREAR